MRRGVTVLEVLVILVFVVLALSIGAMLLVRHRENSLQAMCANNLRRIGLAMHEYHDGSAADEKQRTFPPSRLAPGYATWAVFLAPYLANDHPLRAWDLEQAYFAQIKDVREARVFLYFCPIRIRSDTLSEAGDVDSSGLHVAGALGDYASVAGDGAANENGPLVSAEVLLRKGERIVRWKNLTGIASLKRGQSYTLLIGEKHVPKDRMGDAAAGDGTLYCGQHPPSFSRVGGPGFPLAPAIDAPVNNNFGSYHNGTCNFLWADGSAKPLTNTINEDVLGRMMRRGD